MGLFILLGFILWGWAEMSAFIYIGGEIGGLFTLLGIFVTAIVGLSLLKSQGGAVMTKIRSDLAQGRAPVGSIADSLSLAFCYLCRGCVQLPARGFCTIWSQATGLKASSMSMDRLGFQRGAPSIFIILMML